MLGSEYATHWICLLHFERHLGIFDARRCSSWVQPISNKAYAQQVRSVLNPTINVWHKNMNELIVPPGIAGDEMAIEVIRLWFAHDDIQIAIRVGKQGTAKEIQLEQGDTWGEILDVLTTQVASALMESHGCDFDFTRELIRESYLKYYRLKTSPSKGEFVDDN